MRYQVRPDNNNKCINAKYILFLNEMHNLHNDTYNSIFVIRWYYITRPSALLYSTEYVYGCTQQFHQHSLFHYSYLSLYVFILSSRNTNLFTPL